MTMAKAETGGAARNVLMVISVIGALIGYKFIISARNNLRTQS
jgi:hypothetical protein